MKIFIAGALFMFVILQTVFSWNTTAENVGFDYLFFSVIGFIIGNFIV